MPAAKLDIVSTIKSDDEGSDYDDVVLMGDPGDDLDTAIAKTKAKLKQQGSNGNNTKVALKRAAPDQLDPAASSKKKNKKSKKNGPAQPSIEAQEKDDQEFASDFEFENGSDLENGAGAGGVYNWDIHGLRAAAKTNENQGVDLSSIISRHRAALKTAKEDESESEESEWEPEPSDDEADERGDVEKDEDDDDVKESEEEEETAVENEDELEDSDSDSDSEQISPEEAARRAAFFASEESIAVPARKKNKDDKDKSKYQKEYERSFVALDVSLPIRRGLDDLKMFHATPIQLKALPIGLAGKDIVGSAITGSGKTGAFLLPILERLMRRPRHVQVTRVAVLLPTRELAAQCHGVASRMAAYTDITVSLLVGGGSVRAQEAELRKKPDVVVATPGRFIDHVRNSAGFEPSSIEILVLDEADRMLDDGFAAEIDEIFKALPRSRQTMLFSATMTDSIDRLIRAGLNKPVRLAVDENKSAVSTLRQEFVRLRKGKEDTLRMPYLLYLCSQVYRQDVIVFFQRKQDAHRARVLFGLAGLPPAAELHGDLTQDQRLSAITAFRNKQAAFLLASDVAARGLDIPAVRAVINYDAPGSYDVYLHRIGRTARAGRSGFACTLVADTDRQLVKAAQKGARRAGAPGSVARHVPADAAAGWVDRLAGPDGLDRAAAAVLAEERTEKALAVAERDLRRGENLVKHQPDILARPKRTWFQSEAEKEAEKERARPAGAGADSDRVQITGISSRLSNKQKKRLDATRERKEGGGGGSGEAGHCPGKSRAVRQQGGARGAGVGSKGAKKKKEGASAGKKKGAKK